MATRPVGMTMREFLFTGVTHLDDTQPEGQLAPGQRVVQIDVDIEATGLQHPRGAGDTAILDIDHVAGPKCASWAASHVLQGYTLYPVGVVAAVGLLAGDLDCERLVIVAPDEGLLQGREHPSFAPQKRDRIAALARLDLIRFLIVERVMKGYDLRRPAVAYLHPFLPGPMSHRTHRLLEHACYRGWRTLPLLLVASLLIGCTNSRLLVAPLYNRLDNRIESRFEALADFSDRQLEEAERLIDTFHVWHRQSELPRYAAFLERMATTLERPEPFSIVEARTTLDTVRGFADRARHCYPVNFGASVVRSLSVSQLADMRAAVEADAAEDRERYREETAEERLEERVERFETAIGRTGVDLDASQRDRVRRLFTEQRSLGREWFALSKAWYDSLFEILADKRDPELARRLREHVIARFDALERRHPEHWKHNRALYERFAVDFVTSLSPEQRDTATAWMRGMADTLASIASDEPSFTPSGDPASGCRPGIDPQV